jgi:antitoxin component YwqK of YwqJK toxin-antitoxin module
MGREHDLNGILTYEGTYLNGKKWKGNSYNNLFHINDGEGAFRDYDAQKKIIYECDYINGERNGHGREFWEERNNNNLNVYERNKLYSEKSKEKIKILKEEKEKKEIEECSFNPQ